MDRVEAVARAIQAECEALMHHGMVHEWEDLGPVAQASWLMVADAACTAFRTWTDNEGDD